MNNKGLRRMLTIGISLIIVCAMISGFLLGKKCFLAVLLMGCLILSIFAYYTYQRFKEIATLNSYFEKILMGDYDLNIVSNEEGELSILQNNIYKATVLMREKNELLAKEKNYLVDMLANISHQLKTPLTSMMMMNELLAKENSKEKRQEFIDIEEQQLNKMNWLIQNLLKLSKLDAGTIQLKKEKVFMDHLIKETMQPFLIQMDIAEITYEVNVSATEIFIDENWTIEALRNIVKNCIEHTQKGGRLTIETSENSLYHQIIIKDTGLGISKEDLPHIFERFYKGKDAGKDSVGIGLALANTIIQKQRGEIKVTSKEDKGTCFEIRFFKSII